MHYDYTWKSNALVGRCCITKPYTHENKSYNGEAAML